MQELNKLVFHHIGFAVRSSEESRAAFDTLGANFFHKALDEDWNLYFQFVYWGYSSDVYGYEAAGVFMFSRGIGVVELVERCKHE